MKWYLILNELLCASFFACISIDYFNNNYSQMSAQVEGYCAKIILTAIVSNMLLSSIQSGLNVYKIIKKLHSKFRLRKTHAETLDTGIEPNKIIVNAFSPTNESFNLKNIPEKITHRNHFNLSFSKIGNSQIE